MRRILTVCLLLLAFIALAWERRQTPPPVAGSDIVKAYHQRMGDL